MKCPLMGTASFPTGEALKFAHADCLKEECAWWYANDECCCVKNLATDSFLLVVSLEKVAKELILLRPPRK